MSYFITFFRNFSTNTMATIFSTDLKREIFVGRWSVPNTHTNIVINRIIDRNNEDHCGVCTNTNEQLTIAHKNRQIISDDEEYYIAFFM